MSDMTEKEANELDEVLTKTTPKVDLTVQGPFIKHHNMMVILDTFSAEYLKAKMMHTKQTPAELIHAMISREMAAAEK